MLIETQIRTYFSKELKHSLNVIHESNSTEVKLELLYD